MTRVGKLNIKLFVEGYTEENYFKNLRKSRNVEISYKEVNMKGGGYTNFYNEIRKSSDSGFIAIFIVVDLDKFIKEPNQVKPFNKLLKYCQDKNKNGKIPYFLIVSNSDFEYFACCHCSKYKNNDTTAYIINKFNYKSLDDFKNDEKIYSFLNSNFRSYTNALTKIRSQTPYISNLYNKDEKGLDIKIKIKRTVIESGALNYFHSNIYELFEIIGVK